MQCEVATLALWELPRYLCESFNSGCVVAVLAVFHMCTLVCPKQSQLIRLVGSGRKNSTSNLMMQPVRARGTGKEG